MNVNKDLPLSTSSIKTRFAYRFLMELKKLNKKGPSSSPSTRERNRRCHKVKLAAYASMASTIGGRRRWSRVLLWKIRNRGRSHFLVNGNKRCVFQRRNPRNEFDHGEARELQKLIPGGEVMDFASLLDETAHYIKCLSMQVKIMRNILNVCSN